jgi:hypothetical protein
VKAQGVFNLVNPFLRRGLQIGDPIRSPRDEGDDITVLQKSVQNRRVPGQKRKQATKSLANNGINYVVFQSWLTG